MPSFGDRSLLYRGQCHPELVVVLDRSIELVDFSIVEAHRDKATHDYYYASGRTRPGRIVTKVRWEDSKHSKLPSDACHILPYPFNPDRDWNNWRRFDILYGAVRMAAHVEGINVRSGLDWDQDFDPFDQTFHDLVHWERVITT